MGKINLGRVILGGIVAGIVYDILGTLVDGMLLAPQWNEGMRALGHTDLTTHQIVWLNLIGIASGILLVLIYASIRPRFGPGPKTAVFAGLLVWAVGTLLPNAGFMWVPSLFSAHLALYTTLGGIVEMVAAALAGAAVYKE